MNFTKKINAVCIRCIDEDDVLTLAIGDDKNEPEDFIIIARFDEDDLSVDECIGFQSESTEYEITSAIESVELNNKEIIITVDDRVYKQTGAKVFHAIFDDSLDKAKVTQYLQEIFKDSSTKLTIH